MKRAGEIQALPEQEAQLKFEALHRNKPGSHRSQTFITNCVFYHVNFYGDYYPTWLSAYSSKRMINWFSNQKKQEARKAARDAKLKEELSAKVRALETNIKQELLDFTEVTVNGKRQRVYVDRITVIDVSPLNRG